MRGEGESHMAKILQKVSENVGLGTAEIAFAPLTKIQLHGLFTCRIVWKCPLGVMISRNRKHFGKHIVSAITPHRYLLSQVELGFR